MSSGGEILKKLAAIRTEAENKIRQAGSAEELAGLRASYLSRKSELNSILKGLKDLSPEDKRTAGKTANEARSFLEGLINEKDDALKSESEKKRLSAMDFSLPGRKTFTGSLHPILNIKNRIEEIFRGIGFDTAEGPEVETDYYNFEALNTPPHHPARDMQDTYYVTGDVLLRTHTSPVQIRLMEKQKPPLRSIMPGRVYRNEEVNSRSYVMFHQVEGLNIDKNVTFGDLRATMDYFAKSFFGSSVKTKFRPSFFPFTEPSAEIDVECYICGSKGCPVCKHSGWLEIGGCGMVDPNVLRAGGIDPEEYSGFAFGMGIERIALLKHRINDIRLFFENDVRFLRQFA
ncbi:MAG: phenylalanine--tRNA ligase subunit alpha [Fibrobacterota bacterium]